MKKTILNLFLLAFTTLSYAQPVGYVENVYKFGESGTYWSSRSTNELIVNPNYGGGLLVNAFSDVHTIFSSMKPIPEGEEIEFYTTLEFLEGDGRFGVGFVTSDNQMFILEFVRTTGRYIFTTRPTSGGNATILFSDNISWDVRSKFGVRIKINKEKQINVEAANNALGWAKRNFSLPITHAGYIASGRAMFKSYSLRLHNPARKPKEKLMYSSAITDFDDNNTPITLSERGLTLWTDTGDSLTTLHKPSYLVFLRDGLHRPSKTITFIERRNKDRVVIIHNYLKGEKLAEHSFPSNGDESVKSFNYQDKLLVIDMNTSTLHSFEIKTGQKIESKKIKIPKKGGYVAAIFDESHLLFYNYKEGTKLINFITGAAQPFPDYKTVCENGDKVYAAKYRELHILDKSTKQKIQTIPLKETYEDSYLTQDKRYILLWGGKNLELINLQNQNTVYQKSFNAEIGSVAVNEETGVIFLVRKDNDGSKSFFLNLATGEEIARVGFENW
ncbi:MAG: hypothetical protein NZM38_00040 [Cytophagales bacterium]|nr:hypothetical protein [Cytophagales bacterium]MDW8383139.1 hypothetical protein [Flammeovirgaceae bacterium]